MWNGLENVLKDEVNLNSFKSALSFSTRACLEGVQMEYYFIHIMCILWLTDIFV